MLPLDTRRWGFLKIPQCLSRATNIALGDKIESCLDLHESAQLAWITPTDGVVL